MAYLPKPIRQKINKLAHRLAMRFEDEKRETIFSEIKALADLRASDNELFSKLIEIESHFRKRI